MKQICCALAQINPTVGDVQGNREKIVDYAQRALKQGARVVVFPECALCGYPPEDLIHKQHFISDCERQLVRLAVLLPPDVVCIVGSPVAGPKVPENAAVIIYGGREQGRYSKMELPNYGVFDELRVFSAGAHAVCIEVDGVRLGLHICEDSWLIESNAVQQQVALRPDAVLNLSASPYHMGKPHERARILGATARTLQAPLLYCNLCGGQDELVFDGGSMMLGTTGEVLARAKRFEEDMLLCSVVAKEDRSDRAPALCVLGHCAQSSETTMPEPRIEPVYETPEDVYRALVLGLADYVNKNRFSSVVIGLSGGIDSALVAVLAADALGADRVTGVTMPSRYSSDGTLSDAGVLARNLGIGFHTVPIQNLFEVYLSELAPLGIGEQPDATEENLQARIRGNILMAMSNKRGCLVLTTGNKSELATGYCTLYGDMAGGFAVLKDVPKMLVFELCRWCNQVAGSERIPDTIITRPPSAELREDQKDSDSLPPYEVLDPIVQAYVEEYAHTGTIIGRGYDEAVVRRIVRLIDLNEYKRRQSPPGIKITQRAFGRDRRMPITNQYRDSI